MRALTLTEKAFTQYSEAYKRYKERKLGTARVNLNQTGGMRSAMQTRRRGSDEKPIVEIYFIGAGPKSPALLARYHNEGTGDLPKREFFGLSEQDQQFVLEDYRENLELFK